MSESTVESALIEIVNDLIHDWGLDLDEPVGGGTQLVAGLDFASVDIIQLCVAIEEHYELKMEFRDLLMNDGSYVDDLSLSQMSAFVNGRLQEHAK